MKCVSKNIALIVIAFSALIILMDSVASHGILRRKTTKKTKVKANEDCAKIFTKFNDATSVKAKPADVIFPQVDQTKDTAKANALTQTKAARKFFNKPNDDANAAIVRAAANLTRFLRDNDAILTILATNDKIGRQTGETGTLGYGVELLKVIGGANADVKDLLINTTALLQQDSTAKNRLAFLGILGDIGACVQDGFNRASESGNKPVQDVKDAINTFFANKTKPDEIKTKSADFYKLYSPDKYYDDGVPATAIGKKLERSSCSKDGTAATFKMDARAGVLNVGEQADKDLKFSGDAQLPKIGWPWQTVNKKLITFCENEPWAGHYSGSLYELILMLELFNRDKMDTAITPDNNKKKLFAGISAAFLVATGMHSAVEVNYVVQKYLSGDATEKRIDLTKDQNTDACKDATKKISELITGISG